MLIPTIIMGVIAVILLAVAFTRGEGEHIAGLKSSWEMILQIIPLLIFAFIISGLVRVMLPEDIIAKWVGTESGFRGIMIGTVAGAFTPGGPYVSLPIVAGLVQTGASIGTIVAFITGWSLWAFSRLPLEVGILGWKVTLIRIAVTFLFAPIAGLLAQLIFGWVKL